MIGTYEKRGLHQFFGRIQSIIDPTLDGVVLTQTEAPQARKPIQTIGDQSPRNFSFE